MGIPGPADLLSPPYAGIMAVEVIAEVASRGLCKGDVMKAVVLVLLSLVMVSSSSAYPEAVIYPGKGWVSKAPADAGMDAEKLQAYSSFVKGRGCVVRGGCMVYTWGDVTKRADIASAAKVFYSHFLFKAVEDGKISSLDEKVSRYEPGLNELNEELGYKDRLITWRHLANQTSCYGVLERPGEAFDYNDRQMALLWDTLFMKVYGATYTNADDTVFRTMLTDIIGCQDNPTFMAFGVDDRPGRVAISVRDFARFGLLYLREGKWKDKQLVSKDFARMAVTSPLSNKIKQSACFEENQHSKMLDNQRTIGSGRIPDNQTDHMGSYSWLWWTNGIDREGKVHWPDVPPDVYGAFGHGGPRAMVVLASLDIVTNWNDGDIHSRQDENHALRLLVESVVGGSRSEQE
jgi:CubicO group peptidase (beta-lactamase class C family)